MKAWVLIGALLLSGVPAWGQAGSSLRLSFRFSRMVLATGDTLSGPVALHFAPDLLYLAQFDGTIRTFAPSAVVACAVQGELPTPGLALRATDPTVVRLFRVLVWQPTHPDQRPEMAFFEQLSASGAVLLVRRQCLVPHVLAALGSAGTSGSLLGPGAPGGFGTGNGGGGGRGAPLQSAVVPRYTTVLELRDMLYLAWPNGEIRPLRNLRKDLLAAFPGQVRQLHDYAQIHRLTYATASELSELVNYANSLAMAVVP